MELSKLKNYNLYFIHIPKNCGTSFTKQFIGREIGHFEITKFPIEFRNRTIAIIRNPFTRLVSTYNYAKMKKNYWHSNDGSTKYPLHILHSYCNTHSFQDFIYAIKNNPECLEMREGIHLKPQYKWITDENNEIISKIIRFENIDSELSNLLNTDVKLMKINESQNIENYKIYYNKETEQIVRDIYKKDFELFGPYDIP